MWGTREKPQGLAGQWRGKKKRKKKEKGLSIFASRIVNIWLFLRGYGKSWITQFKQILSKEKAEGENYKWNLRPTPFRNLWVRQFDSESQECSSVSWSCWQGINLMSVWSSSIPFHSWHSLPTHDLCHREIHANRIFCFQQRHSHLSFVLLKLCKEALIQDGSELLISEVLFFLQRSVLGLCEASLIK